MDRRTFLAASAGGALASAPSAMAAAARRPSRAEGAAIATYVTNLRDYGGRSAMPAAGARVVLVRVRDRTYDPLSVAVLAQDGRQLGFLPGGHARVLAPLMDAGLRFGASVVEGTDGRTPRLALDIEFLDAGGAA